MLNRRSLLKLIPCLPICFSIAEADHDPRLKIATPIKPVRDRKQEILQKLISGELSWMDFKILVWDGRYYALELISCDRNSDSCCVQSIKINQHNNTIYSRVELLSPCGTSLLGTTFTPCEVSHTESFDIGIEFNINEIFQLTYSTSGHYEFIPSRYITFDPPINVRSGESLRWDGRRIERRGP